MPYTTILPIFEFMFKMEKFLHLPLWLSFYKIHKILALVFLLGWLRLRLFVFRILSLGDRF